jgi:hypothetical protein
MDPGDAFDQNRLTGAVVAGESGYLTCRDLQMHV